MPMDTETIFKVLKPEEWQAWQAQDPFEGAPIDLADGFIHLSTADQVEETIAKHFAGAGPLVLVAVDGQSLGPDLKWEPSRGGALFPHLYAPLPQQAVLWTHTLDAEDSGGHLFPDNWKERRR